MTGKVPVPVPRKILPVFMGDIRKTHPEKIIEYVMMVMV